MDVKELINLGGELRGIGHRRHQLAERVSRGANEGDSSESRELYEELESVTSQAISLMEKQRDILRARDEPPGQPAKVTAQRVEPYALA